MMAPPRRCWVQIVVAASLLAQAACAVAGDAFVTGRPAAGPARLASLPLTLVAGPDQGDTFVVFYSGDNGWGTQVRGVAARLAADKAPVVGISALRYFLRRKTPDEAAADLALIVDHYGQAWKRSRVILVGYSFGADALPLIAERLPPDVRSRVRLLALISPSDHGDLAFRGVSWFDGRWPGAKPLTPALRALAGTPMICIHADHDPRAACDRFPTDLIRPVGVPGGHRYDGRRDIVADVIAGWAGLTVE